MDLRDVGERDTIKRLQSTLGTMGDLGRGEDDCAVVDLGDGRYLLASTDVMVGRTHLLPGTPPDLYGTFVVNTAVSDIAAMGGDPMGVLTALAMPPATDLGWLMGLYRGIASATRDLGVTILGGDTKASGDPTVAATALGTVEGTRCLFRRGAQPGDVLVLTGPVGGPALGFITPKRGNVLPRDALDRVYGVKARTDAGKALAASGHATACIDLSDGFAPALHQLLEASRMGATVVWEDIPIARGLREVAATTGHELEDVALHWGGEYELLATVDPAGVEEVMATMRRLRLEPRAVGIVEDGRKVLLVSEGSSAELSPQGFDHFKGG
jgi:thiamine-monophosphate kinase